MASSYDERTLSCESRSIGTATGIELQPHGAAIVGIVAVLNQRAIVGLTLKRLRAALRTGVHSRHQFVTRIPKASAISSPP